MGGHGPAKPPGLAAVAAQKTKKGLVQSARGCGGRGARGRGGARAGARVAVEQLQDAGARLRQRGRERDAARAEGATLQRERDEALRERDAARKQLAARNDMLAQVLKEQQY